MQALITLIDEKTGKVFVKSVIKPSREEYDIKTDTWKFDFDFHFNLMNSYFEDLLNKGMEGNNVNNNEANA